MNGVYFISMDKSVYLGKELSANGKECLSGKVKKTHSQLRLPLGIPWGDF